MPGPNRDPAHMMGGQPHEGAVLRAAQSVGHLLGEVRQGLGVVVEPYVHPTASPTEGINPSLEAHKVGSENRWPYKDESGQHHIPASWG